MPITSHMSGRLDSDDEIRTLLKATKARTSIDPLRPWTYHCLFGMLAVTGLRLGEALNLRIGDTDWSEGILTIRGAKFGKSRLVPLHASWLTTQNAGISASACAPMDISW